MMQKQIKVAVREGGGPPPGYEWSIGVWEVGYSEAIDLLSGPQYRHLADQFKDLARYPDPTHSETLDLRPVEEFFELRDKGGILGKLNMRVFYTVDRKRRVIVVLGVVKKENEGATSVGDKIRIRRRMRKYDSGDYGVLQT